MRILFVCTGNSCRSVMAERYLQKRLKESGRKDVEVLSAGTSPFAGMRATEGALKVLAEEGADASDYYAKRLTRPDVTQADLIFIMERRHKRHVEQIDASASGKTYFLKDFKKLGDFRISGEPDIADPVGRDIEFYRKVFSVIKSSVENVLREI